MIGADHHVRLGPPPDLVEPLGVLCVNGQQQTVALSFAVRDVSVGVVDDAAVRRHESRGVVLPLRLEPHARDLRERVARALIGIDRRAGDGRPGRRRPRLRLFPRQQRGSLEARRHQ